MALPKDFAAAPSPTDEKALWDLGEQRRLEACKRVRVGTCVCALTNRVIHNQSEVVVACFFAQEPPEPRWLTLHIDSVPTNEYRGWDNLQTSTSLKVSVVNHGQLATHWRQRKPC